MRPIAPVLVAVLALPPGAAALAAQSELVIHKEGTKLYHRPGCPVVQDLKGVLVMTRAQAKARSYTAHPECDQAAGPGASGLQDPNAATVYVDSGKHYHRKDCKKLGPAAAVKTATLDSAAKGKWPCPDCKPPIRQSTKPPAVPGFDRRRGR